MSDKALRLVVDEFASFDDVAVDLIETDKLDLRLPGREGGDGEAIRKRFENATGVVFATPEYHGGVSSVSKLIIDNLGFPSVLAGKPIALLGVAAGRIGAIKALEQLRSICSHIGGLVMPAVVSVAGVQSVFDDAGKCTDPAVEKQVRGVAHTLNGYIRGHVCPRITLEAMMRGKEK